MVGELGALGGGDPGLQFACVIGAESLALGLRDFRGGAALYQSRDDLLVTGQGEGAESISGETVDGESGIEEGSQCGRGVFAIG